MRVQKVLGSILVLALFGSLALNWKLFQAARQAYADELSVRLHPVRSDLSEPLTGSPIVFLGDSRVDQWPIPDTAKNLGVSSETTAQIKARLAQNLGTSTPRLVVIQAGINDLKAIGVLPEYAEIIERECEANLREICRGCVSRGSNVVLTTIFPTGPVPIARQPFWSSGIESARKRVNDSLLKNPPAGTQVLDADKILATLGGGIKPEFATDTLHLNGQGYKQLNTAVAAL